MLKVQLQNGKGDNTKLQVMKRNGWHAIPVLTDPLRDGVFEQKALLNDDFGDAINQNAATGGTPVGIHNGTDTVLWTGTNVVGSKVTFDSTTRPNAGTKSVEIDNPALNDIWQFDRGSDLTVSSYVSLSGVVNIDKDWTSGDSVAIYGWDTAGATEVGTRVFLEDYINETNFDVWQGLSIPLSDMNLVTGTIDAIRMEQVGRNGKAARWYLDTFQVEETGSPISFKAKADKGTKLHVNKIVLSVADVGTGATAHAYNKLGALSALTNGVVLRADVDGEMLINLNIKQESDILEYGGIYDVLNDDGTNTYKTISLDVAGSREIILDSRNDDEISISVNDDLTGLLLFTAQVRGWREVI